MQERTQIWEGCPLGFSVKRRYTFFCIWNAVKGPRLQTSLLSIRLRLSSMVLRVLDKAISETTPCSMVPQQGLGRHERERAIRASTAGACTPSFPSLPMNASNFESRSCLLTAVTLPNDELRPASVLQECPSATHDLRCAASKAYSDSAPRRLGPASHELPGCAASTENGRQEECCSLGHSRFQSATPLDWLTRHARSRTSSPFWIGAVARNIMTSFHARALAGCSWHVMHCSWAEFQAPMKTCATLGLARLNL